MIGKEKRTGMIRKLNFNDIKGHTIYVVFDDGRIKRFNLQSEPSALFDISGYRFSDGFGGSWNYNDFGATWGFDAFALIKPRYDALMESTHDINSIKRAMQLDDYSMAKVLRAYFNGFYGTLYGEQYTDGVTVTKIKRPSVDRDGNMFIIVGMPGPDVIKYCAKDYGKTWALTEEELMRKETN